jgi:hypothetical protein
LSLKLIGAAVIAACLGVWAAVWGAVEAPVYFAGDLAHGWETGAGEVDEDARRGARLRLERAHAVNPLNASYALTLGRIHFARALQFPVGDEEARAERAQAVRYFRDVTEVRPAWGRGWAFLARTKMYEPDLDDEFYAALERATILGPWEPEVQDSIAWTGMSTWDRLPPAMRERVRVTVRRMLDHYPRDRYAMEMAVRLRWEAELGGLALNPEQARWLQDRVRSRGAS